MDKRIIAIVVYAILGFVGASRSALAETIGRLECGIVGAPNLEPIGDRDGHRLLSVQYSCLGVEGLLKGAMYTSSSASEWEGSRVNYLAGGGIMRTPGGLAVIQLNEGQGSVVMKDGKPVGSETTGKSLVKFASGAFAELAGKTLGFEVKPAGFNRFSLEFKTDSGADALRTSKQ